MSVDVRGSFKRWERLANEAYAGWSVADSGAGVRGTRLISRHPFQDYLARRESPNGFGPLRPALRWLARNELPS